MKVYELTDLDLKQIKRIVDYFSLGKILNYKLLSDTKLFVKTNHGSYFLININSDQWHNSNFSISNIYQFSKFVKNLLYIKHGKILLNESKKKVNLTHKYGKYYFCAEI